MTEPSRPRAAARKLALAVPPIRRLVADRDELRRAKRRAEKQLASAQRQIAQLKQHVAELSAGAPAAGAGTPQRPLGYLFIVTYGRSGSTLVQGLLGSVPGYLIRGENRGVLYRLYQYHSALEAARDEFSRIESLTTRDSWFGIDQYAASTSIARMRALLLDGLLKPQPDTRVIGFKEIRWFYDDWEPYLDFVREVFPGARFVINTRDREAVASSQWWSKQRRADVLRKLAGYERQLDAMVALLGDAAFRVHYDDYVVDPKTLAGLFEWLGEPFDLDAVTRTMAVKHSF